MVVQCSFGVGVAFLLCVGKVFANPVLDCPRIQSNVERLACFDDAAGTPARAEKRRWTTPERVAPTVLAVMASEAQRAPDDLTFHLSDQGEGPTGQDRLMITAPAIAALEPRPHLVISCVQNISRLQLLTGQPIDAKRVTVQLQTERRNTNAVPWQVMEHGQVLDAGRGLPAIEQIKTLLGAHRIRVVSDHPLVNGLSFDAQGLDPLIDEARKTCRW